MPYVIAGLSWLLQSLIGLIPTLVAFFATWMTKRVAIAAAMVAAFVTLTAAFYGSISGIVSGLSVVTPTYFNDACAIVLPSNTTACVSAYLATVAARWIYDVQIKVLNYSNPGAGF